MLTALEDGLWEADARLELDELREAVDARLIAEDDEVDTVGGLAFLLAGRILGAGRIGRASAPAGGSKRSTADAPQDQARPAPRARARGWPDARLVLREQIGRVGHRLEFERIARRDRGRTSSPARPAGRRSGPSARSRNRRPPRQPVGQRAPLVHRQHQPEMRHRHVLAIDRVGGAGAHRVGREMRDDLVAVEIEVDPMVASCALPGSRAARRKRRARRRDRRPERRGGRAAGVMRPALSLPARRRNRRVDCGLRRR